MKLILEAELSDKAHSFGHPLAEVVRPLRIWGGDWRLTVTVASGLSVVITREPDVQVLRWLNVWLRMGRLTLAEFVGAAWGHDLIDPLIDEWDEL